MPTTYNLIAKQTLSGVASTVSFTSIPSTFSDLLLSYSARTDRAAPNPSSDIYLRFNNVSTATYSFRRVYAPGTLSDSLTNNSSGGFCGWATGAGATASTFGNCQIYIPNYAGSTTKSFITEGVAPTNATDGRVAFYGSLWSGTQAITQIDLRCYNGSLFVSGSSFFLYGITKA